MNFKKKSFTLLELIVSISILSVLVIGTLLFQAKLIQEDKYKRQIESYKIDLLSSKIFLEKNLNSLDELKYLENKLFYKDILFLDKVTDFEKNSDETNFYIKIVLDEKIKNFWVIKK
jgi:type II secretory pathway component PulJ